MAVAQLNSIKIAENQSSDGGIAYKNYKLDLNLDKVFGEEYGNFKVKAKFTYNSITRFVLTQRFQLNESEFYDFYFIIQNDHFGIISPHFAYDCSEIHISDLIYMHAPDFKDDRYYSKLSLTEGTEYIIEISYYPDKVNIQISDINDSEKIVFNKDFTFKFFSLFSTEELKNMKTFLVLNSLSFVDPIIFNTRKNELEEDFVYAGAETFQSEINEEIKDDFLGVISFDESIQVLSRNKDITDNINTEILDSSAVFVNNIQSRPLSNPIKYLFRNNGSKSYKDFLEFNLNISNLKNSFDNINLLFKFFTNESNHNYGGSIFFNDNKIVSDIHRTYNSLFLINFNLLNSKYTFYQINLSALNDNSISKLKWIKLKEDSLIDNLNIKMKTSHFYRTGGYDYFFKVFIFKNQSNILRYLPYYYYNYNFPIFDKEFFNTNCDFIGFEV